ncbi:MAG TPA: epoxide hydrolase [Steroidobacteraceae bacterium]|jgi:pimeloyl-ACP methyl ester carboxylesterase|nr:epoxide hydrolase [Steroidobacteraceae bacterium]
MVPQPFALSISDAAIIDLKKRLDLTRFPDAAPGEPWAYGTSVDYIRDLVAYWKDHFDWRAQEAALNEFPQFRVPVHDIDLHYLHVRGVGPNPYPLLLLHGWPGSVYEFLDIIPRLTDPARFGDDPRDAFSIIAPSLPGYGLSFKPGQKRFILQDMAACLHDFMTEILGFKRFAVQGGDLGAGIASIIGQRFPSSVCGIHLNLLFAPRDQTAGRTSTEEKRYADKLVNWLKEETGYQQIQGTKPQTLAFGLTDSPAGLAAWIAEKFRSWSDCDGIPENAINRDRLLANISLYWFTAAIGSSFWPYYGRLHSAWPISPAEPITVPTGYAAFPKEIIVPPRSIAEKTYINIQRWTEMKKGGHFAAMEQPAELAEEIHHFFRPLR